MAGSTILRAMRSIVIAIVMLGTSACIHAQPATARSATSPATVTFRGSAEIERTTNDQLARQFTVCGLSGIAHAGGDTYWAVMDNSDKLVRMKIEVGADGTITSAKVEGGLTLADRRDFEGIVVRGGNAFISEENTPGVSEY